MADYIRPFSQTLQDVQDQVTGLQENSEQLKQQLQETEQARKGMNDRAVDVHRKEELLAGNNNLRV